MFYNVIEFEILPSYCLRITFSHGKTKIFDVKRLFDRDLLLSAFFDDQIKLNCCYSYDALVKAKQLESDEELFYSVKNQPWMKRIIWENNFFLTYNQLYKDGVENSNEFESNYENDSILKCKRKDLQNIYKDYIYPSHTLFNFSELEDIDPDFDIENIIDPSSQNNNIIIDFESTNRANYLGSIVIPQKEEKYHYNEINKDKLKASTLNSQERILLIGKTSDSTIEIKGENNNIDKNILRNFDDLIEVTITDAVYRIDDNAFNNCKKLKIVNLPETVKIIGDNAFNGCYDLFEIKLPNGLEIIGNSAFKGCVNLNKVIIPQSVKRIDDSAFFDCKNLRIVIFF